MIVTETDRLHLRHFCMDDLDVVSRILSDPEVMHYSTGLYSVEQTRRWIEGCLEDYTPERWGFGLWGVIVKETGELIGYCGLTQFDDIDGRPEVEIGYRLARSHWGQGIATEAALATRDYAFSHLGIDRLISLIEEKNIASVRVSEKIGMVREKEIIKWGRPVWIYAIHKHEVGR